MISRRLFLGGLLAGAAAPAIVRAEYLMKGKPVEIVLPEQRLIMSGSVGMIENFSVHDSTYIENAFRDPKAYKELGEHLAEMLYRAANREGFMRKFLAREKESQRGFKKIISGTRFSPVRFPASR